MLDILQNLSQRDVLVPLWAYSITVFIIVMAYFHFDRPKVESSAVMPTSAANTQLQQSRHERAAVFPDTPLVDQYKTAFRVRFLHGKTVLLNFMSTENSRDCAITIANLVEIQEMMPPEYRDHIHFISITTDPLADSPEVLKVYADMFGVDHRNWSWLTGSQENILKVMDAFGLSEIDHPYQWKDTISDVLLLDAHGRITQRYRGDNKDTLRIAREALDLSILFVEPRWH